MQKIIVMCLCVMLLVSTASARTVWRPHLNPTPIVAPDAGDWSDPDNWSAGVPVGLPESVNTAGKVVFYDQGATADCWVTTTDAICGYFVLADNEEMQGALVVKSGATLSTSGDGGWCAVGFNRPGGLVIVERGATLDLDSHLYIGMNGDLSKPTEQGEGRLIINGGTVIVADTFRYGREPNCKGYVDLNAGYFEARYLNGTGPYGGLFDIRFGTYLLTGGENSDRNRLQRDIDNGYIVGFGGASAVNLQEADNGDWFVTVDDPMEADPEYANEQVYYEDVYLSWKNMEPNNPATALVNVWFGQLEEGSTEPNRMGPLYNMVLENEPWTEFMSVLVGEDDGSGTYYTALGEYYWQVEIVEIGSPNIDSPLYYFSTTDNLPPWDVSAGADQITWAGRSMDLPGSYGDEGAPTVLWESDDPNTVFDPSDDGGVTGNAAAATATVDYAAGDVTLTFTVDDGVNPAVSDTMTVSVYTDACDAARNGAGLGAGYPGDFDGNCIINLADVAEEIARVWEYDYSLTDPIPE